MKIAAVVACIPLLAAGHTSPATTQSMHARASQSEAVRGLSVKLLPPAPESDDPLRFVLSEKAYVAAFMVYPGAGVRLLYPTTDSPERLWRAGFNRDPLMGVQFDNDAYHVVLGPGISGPSYLYIIASRKPLDVARYVHRPMRLALAVGEHESRSFYANVALDAVVDHAVSVGDDDSWDSDVYMLWPSAGPEGARRIPAAYFTRLLCADGRSSLVPINYPFSGCPGQMQLRPVRAQLQPQLAAVRNDAAAVPSLQRTQAAADAVTVLPTIVGTPRTAAQREAAARQSASQRLDYVTVANGDAVSPTPADAAAPGAQIIESGNVMRAGGGRADGRSDRDALHGAYSAEHRAQYRDQALRRGQEQGRNQDGGQFGDHVGGNPVLAPPPRLSPPPTLAPPPRLSPPPTPSPAPGSVQPSRAPGSPH